MVQNLTIFKDIFLCIQHTHKKVEETFLYVLSYKNDLKSLNWSSSLKINLKDSKTGTLVAAVLIKNHSPLSKTNFN